jgi:hypothetical protein
MVDMHIIADGFQVQRQAGQRAECSLVVLEQLALGVVLGAALLFMARSWFAFTLRIMPCRHCSDIVVRYGSWPQARPQSTHSGIH